MRPLNGVNSSKILFDASIGLWNHDEGKMPSFISVVLGWFKGVVEELPKAVTNERADT